MTLGSELVLHFFHTGSAGANGIDLKLQDKKDGDLPLNNAALAGETACVDALLQNDRDEYVNVFLISQSPHSVSDERVDVNGGRYPALIYAAYKGHTACLARILQDNYSRYFVKGDFVLVLLKPKSMSTV